MSTVITVENLGKKYLLSHQSQKQPYVALRDVITERANALGRRLLRPFNTSHLTPDIASKEDFWALKDVSFEIKQGGEGKDNRAEWSREVHAS
jgi:lipopolysaccharide transport system ATP-binding protein